MMTLSGCDNNKSTGEKTVEGITIVSGDVTYTLDNAEEVNKEFPDTFWIPSQEIRESLEVGQLVQLLFRITNGSDFQVERMWVEIIKKSDEGYEGILDNDPYCTKKITSGLKVNFKSIHVIDVYEYEPLDEDSQPVE